MAQRLTHVLLWALIFLAAISLYSFRDELGPLWRRVYADLIPGAAIATGPREVMISSYGRRGFEVSARVNDRPVRFRFDTGATMVTLNPETARAAGVDVTRLAYDVTVSTAAGLAKAAPVTLDSVAIGGIVERQVPALVSRPGDLSENLLGMSFLSRLSSYEIAGERLTLRGRVEGTPRKP